MVANQSEYNKYIYDKGFCCDNYDKLLFENIAMHDYLKPIKLLKEYYETVDNSYYVNLYEKYNEYDFETPLCITDYNYDLDEIMLQYASCFKNLKLLVFFTHDIDPNTTATSRSEPFSQQSVPSFVSGILNTQNSSIHCYKKFQINIKQYYPLVYQLVWHNCEQITFDYIKRKTSELNLKSKYTTINIILYDSSNDKIASLIDKEGYNCLCYDTRSYVIDLIKLFFNKNSIRLLQYQRVDRLLYGDYNSSLILLMTFKNWLYQEILPKDQIRFMIFSSGILFSLGIRNMRDIDLIANFGKMRVPDTVTKFLINDSTKFPFIDIHIKKDDKWYANDKHQEYLSEWFDKEWPCLYDANNMEQTILNPKYHYYYCGIKLISMKADITRRIKRNRAAAFADLIALTMFTNIKIPIINLDKGCWKEHKYYEYTDAEIRKMLKTVKYYMKKKYRVKMSIEEILKYIDIKK